MACPTAYVCRSSHGEGRRVQRHASPTILHDYSRTLPFCRLFYPRWHHHVAQRLVCSPIMFHSYAIFTVDIYRSIAFDSTDCPEEFTPERFLKSEGHPLDPHTYSFGFGRRCAHVFQMFSESLVHSLCHRVCPGKQLADNSIFIFVASILSVFTICKEFDKLGNEIRVQPSFGEGLVRYVSVPRAKLSA